MNDVSFWTQSVAKAVAERVGKRNCHPTATYRIQFEPGKFTFRDLARLATYLNELGISHVYASPYMKARAGCTHGYAVVDYAHLNPELGNESDYRAMVEELHSRGLGQIIDMVPNHMSATPAENLWWNDVLENGPSSPHAAYFDIDWQPVKEELRNKILLPILGEQYGRVLEAGELKLEYREGAILLRYWQSLLPLDPRTYVIVLTHGLDELKKTQPPDSEEVRELESIVTGLEHLPERMDAEPNAVAERQREKEVLKGRLRVLTDREATIAEFVRRNIDEFNGSPGNPHSYDCLDKLLDAQAYRLSHWKAAADEINYRRFFDVNELAAVCMEDRDVFAECHRLMFNMLVRGEVDGLRIDHIDGQYDPTKYLRRLQRGYLLAVGQDIYERMTQAGRQPVDAPGQAPLWNDLEPTFLPLVAEMTLADAKSLPLYVVVEKILTIDETLPEQWLAAGTTGYDFLNSVAGVFVDPAGLAELANSYSHFIGRRFDFREVAYLSKLTVFRTAMSSDLQLLAHRLNRISERHRHSRDFTLNTLRVALREILACFGVYRTYIREDYVSDRDRQTVCRAAAQAKRRNPAMDAAVFDFIRNVLLLEGPPDLDETGRRERNLFVGRVQQVTSSVMAKGVEDTAFYRYFPLASLNEVGGDLIRGVTSIEAFHRQNLARHAAWPESLICTTTHDTKRSEDVRARISVLSEVPHLWRKAVNRWARLNRRRHREVDGEPAPSRNDEYLFYQTLVGVWPLTPPSDKELDELRARMTAYMEKATREAKVHTSWITPDSEYDAAVREFVSAALDNRPKNRFVPEFQRFHEQIVNWGLYNALSQLLLKLTSPGVPDIYQGQELWDFSLVDPDNRRPVDFAVRKKMLLRLRKDVGRNERSLLAVARRLAEDPRDARLKLFVTWRVLQFRSRHPDLFRSGDYVALEVSGPQARNVCAFARVQPSPSGAKGETAVVITPCLVSQLTPLGPDTLTASPPLGSAVWKDTFVAVGDLISSPATNLFTGQEISPENGRIRLDIALSDFPAAVLSVV
jgi:(1->4)-alpha-D-glucan 1-alpha-D-glucosylmutase